MSSRVEELKQGLTAAGFRSAPFARILWALRRLIWPIIRQYHYFQVEQLDLVAATADEFGEVDWRGDAEFGDGTGEIYSWGWA